MNSWVKRVLVFSVIWSGAASHDALAATFDQPGTSGPVRASDSSTGAPSQASGSPTSEPSQATSPTETIVDDEGRVKELEKRIQELREGARYADAIALAEELAAIRKRARSGEHWATQDAQRLVSTLTRVASLPPEAQAELAEAERIDAQFADLLGKGKQHEAIEPLRGQLQVRQRLLGMEHPDTARSMSNLATALRGAIDYRAAEPLFRDTLAMRRKLFGETHPAVAESLQDLASLLRAKGDYPAAESLYRQALLVRQQLYGPRHADVGRSLNNLGLILVTRGDYTTAESLYREALGIFRDLYGEEHPFIAGCLLNLVGVLKLKGDLVGADEAARNALAMFRKLKDKEHSDVTAALATWASILHKQRKYTEAEEAYREVLARRQRQFAGRQHPAIANAMHNLASLFYLKGDFGEAEPLYREALAMRRSLQGDRHQNVCVNLTYLGHTLRGKGDYAAAEPLYREALMLTESYRVERAAGEQQRAEVSYLTGLGSAATGLAITLIKLGKPADALAVLERGRGRELMDLLARGDRDLSAEVHETGDDEAAARFDRAVAAETEARATLTDAEAKVARTKTDKELPDLDKQQLIAAQQTAVASGRRELADAELAVLNELRSIWPDTQPATTEQIRSVLAPNELLMSFLWQRDSVMLLVVPPAQGGEIEAFAVVEGVEAVESFSEAVKNVRAGFAGRPVQKDAPPDDSAIGHELFEKLIPSSVRERVLSASRLVIVPDGPLREIPFEALPLRVSDSKAGAIGPTPRRILDAGPEVVYVDSATVYVNRLQERARRPAVSWKSVTALIVGDPVYTHGILADGAQQLAMAFRSPEEGAAEVSALDQIRLHGGVLSSLPGTRREANLIADAVRHAGGAATVLLADEATLPRLERSLSGQRLVHVATHGLTGSQERPYDASLALTQPTTPTPEDIGFLTLDHLIRRWRGKLKDCELVVLSACDTQRGVKTGGSVMTLPWGFFYAGAPTVVASLWKVDDLATQLLMTRFYENILGEYRASRAGLSPGTPMPKAAALREAKQWLRELSPREISALSTETKTGGERATLDTELPVPADRVAPDFSHPHYWAGFILLGAPN